MAKYFLGVLSGLLLAFFSVVFLVFIVALISGASGGGPTVAEDTVLNVNLTGGMPERVAMEFSLESLVVQLVDPPFAKVGAFPLDTFLPRKNRMEADHSEQELADPSRQVRARADLVPDGSAAAARRRPLAARAQRHRPGRGGDPRRAGPRELRVPARLPARSNRGRSPLGSSPADAQLRPDRGSAIRR